MSTTPDTRLPDELHRWLHDHADSLDQGSAGSNELLTRLGAANLFLIGVATEQGGLGGRIQDAIDAIAAVAEQSLTAAFVFWGHRTYIEYLLYSPNTGLRDRELPQLLTGQLAGATGLSNAMKYLSGIENLQLTATPTAEGWVVNGRLPWVTNLQPTAFRVAAVVAHAGDQPPAILVLSSDDPGLVRSPDLDLVALRGSQTAAIEVNNVRISADRLIHADALTFCPAIRPSFLGLQLGLSLGLARASLQQATRQAGHGRSPALLAQIQQLQEHLQQDHQTLHQGLEAGRFTSDAASLFRLRIQLAERVQQAVALELEASGGRAYLLDQNRDFARRLKESAFIPVVTPSLSQLRGELDKHQAGAA